MHGRSHNVLVGNADVGTLPAIIVDGTDRTLVGRGDGGYDDGAALHMVGIELNTGRRATIAVGRLMHHVNLLLRTHTRHVAVVANANEQPSTVGIGKGRYRTGQLHGIGHAVFEVLLLVLALLDKAQKILLVVHSVAKIHKIVNIKKNWLVFYLALPNLFVLLQCHFTKLATKTTNNNKINF